ncbi:MAG TPA: hypothetical protein VKV17_11290 [Bryobacteraceae bacterium]|nr:hypothetical protein [Bryobacteraceae bacterium]
MNYGLYQVKAGSQTYNVIVASREVGMVTAIEGAPGLTAEQVAQNAVAALAGSGGESVTPLVGRGYTDVPGIVPAAGTGLLFGFGNVVGEPPPDPPNPPGNYALIVLGPQDRLLAACWPAS